MSGYVYDIENSYFPMWEKKIYIQDLWGKIKSYNSESELGKY